MQKHARKVKSYQEDVKKFIRNCPECIHKPKPKGRAPMKLYYAGAPMERIEWMEAVPLPNQEASMVADALVETVICRLGMEDPI